MHWQRSRVAAAVAVLIHQYVLFVSHLPTGMIYTLFFCRAGCFSVDKRALLPSQVSPAVAFFCSHCQNEVNLWIQFISSRKDSLKLLEMRATKLRLDCADSLIISYAYDANPGTILARQRRHRRSDTNHSKVHPSTSMTTRDLHCYTHPDNTSGLQHGMGGAEQLLSVACAQLGTY